MNRWALVLTLAGCATTTPLPPVGLPKFHTQQAVMQQVLEAAPAIKECAADARLNEREVRDTKLLPDWTIHADGTVGDVVSQSPDLHGTTWERCVMHVIEQLHYPAAGGEDRIRMPFLM